MREGSLAVAIKSGAAEFQEWEESKTHPDDGYPFAD